MKTELTKTGWKETTVKKFNIISLHKHLPDMTTKKWLECSNKIYKGNPKGMRLYCPVCKIKWENIEGKINSAMTDKGNQAVCDSCFVRLQNL